MKNNNLDEPLVLRSVAYILPEYLACYLINGDTDTITEEEKQEIDSFLKKENLPLPVSCGEESYFAWSNDMNNIGANVIEYYFID